MRQLILAGKIKKAVAVLIVFLLIQTSVSAQSEQDTIVESSSVVYQQEEEVPQQPSPPSFRKVPDSVIAALKRKKEFAYANDPAYWVREKPDNKPTWIEWLISQTWFRYLILGLMTGILLFAIIRIALSNRLFILRSSKKSGRTEEDELLQMENLSSLIQEAEVQQDFRLAIRYRYMKALQDMDQRQLIQLNAQYTNWDYVNKLGSHPLKKQFLLLTRAYEYAWYGEFHINQDQYGYIRSEFQQFENSLG
ncbi:MAG TPA: DUF4129 domain-containing protein [Chitinophagaceae bacterium]